MDQGLRKKKLEDIQKNEKPFMTGIRIRYQGESRSFNAYKIPLDFLIYNKYNGRIGSLVKSFEKQNHILNAEIDADIKLIEKFLWESKPDRNEITMKSLAEEGQKQYGIVTNDGVIIDGNRRAMLLNRIYRDRKEWGEKAKNVDECRYFIAAILPEGADPREVVRLETVYQMGEDAKLDYNPIEKYLRCKDLRDVHGYTEWDIAKMMGEKESQIKEWLEILEVMERYLEYLDYQGIYTRLDKREGQFVDLTRYLGKYKNNKSAFVSWDYEEQDISNLEAVCFDYIRAQYEGKEFRYIAQPSRKDGIFCREPVWKQFLNDHTQVVDNIQEGSVEEKIAENPGADLTTILESRDEEWKLNVENDLKKNLNIAKRKLEDISEANEPLVLANRAYNTLQSINTDSDAFFDQELCVVLHEIERLAYQYRKSIEKADKK